MNEALADDLALLAQIVALPVDEQWRLIRSLPDPVAREWKERWDVWAHGGQRSPDGDPLVWMILAGRGFGKTRAGAEWLSAQARGNPEGRFALVAATMDDARRVMIEGTSGLIAVARTGEEVRWLADKGELAFASGAIAFIYSAEAAEGLRGPEHHAAWCDELGKWGRSGRAAWDNLMMGLRLGDHPRVLVTTTPRANALVRRVERLAARGDAVTRGRTTDNPHLPASFVAAMLEEYGGTRLGRQELDGELLADVEGAMWTRGLLERCRQGALPPASQWVRVVVGVDPPAGSDRGAGDACGIVVAAIDAAGVGHVLADASVQATSPEGWARAVAAAAQAWGADRVVAEANNGGQMVRSVLKGADIRLPVKLVRAAHGKVVRAEPVFTLYEAGRVRHRGAFPALEDEMCGLLLGGGYEPGSGSGPGGPGRSPDRADALVWALTELMLHGKAAVRVRRL